MYDQRGSGKSYKSSIDEELLTLEQFVDDLDNLRKHLGKEKVILLGHSWGSFLAIAYALAHPQHTTNLILMGPQPMCHRGMQEFEGAFNKRLAALKNKFPTALFNTSEHMDPEQLAKFYRVLSAAFCFDPNKAKELTLNYELEADNSGKRAAQHINQQLFEGEWDYHSNLRELTVPTLIIHGSHDPIPVWVAQRINDELPNSKIEIIDQCGHFPYLEQPEAFFNIAKSILISYKGGADFSE